LKNQPKYFDIHSKGISNEPECLNLEKSVGLRITDGFLQCKGIHGGVVTVTGADIRQLLDQHFTVLVNPV